MPEAKMYNWFTIEVEAADRRHEWERAAEADVRAALAGRDGFLPGWLQLPRLSRPRLIPRSLPRLAFAGPAPATSAAECAC
jgi:hypothetical protein